MKPTIIITSLIGGVVLLVLAILFSRQLGTRLPAATNPADIGQGTSYTDICAAACAEFSSPDADQCRAACQQFGEESYERHSSN